MSRDDRILEAAFARLPPQAELTITRRCSGRILAPRHSRPAQPRAEHRLPIGDNVSPVLLPGDVRARPSGESIPRNDNKSPPRLWSQRAEDDHCAGAEL